MLPWNMESRLFSLSLVNSRPVCLFICLGVLVLLHSLFLAALTLFYILFFDHQNSNVTVWHMYALHNYLQIKLMMVLCIKRHRLPLYCRNCQEVRSIAVSCKYRITFERAPSPIDRPEVPSSIPVSTMIRSLGVAGYSY